MIRSVTCADCGVAFEHHYVTGAPPQRCPTCQESRRRATNAAKGARWRAANPERARDAYNKSNRKRLADPVYVAKRRVDVMRKRYGITPEDYAAMLAAQGGKCAICHGGPNGPGTRLHVDHCHNGGQVRGLLCSKCNTAVGLLDNDPARADALAVYLRR